MSKLLLRPDAGSLIHRVTPLSAGWAHVGFEVHALVAGSRIQASYKTREACLVLVSGRARIKAGQHDFGVLGGRMSPFDGAPDSVYIPAPSEWTVECETDVEIAICTAPGAPGFSPRVIRAPDVAQETRGTGTNTRYVRNILPETAPANALLVVEVITPGGHWSSYPPHKHDTLDLPNESALEETYYHHVKPAQGYAHQRVYTDDRTLDETMTVHDRDVVLVPRGYHPVAAAHGYDLWYLNVMAGPVRTWKFRDDPSHAWLKRP
jgi:5-deoxy-glucuronate isomerase